MTISCKLCKHRIQSTKPDLDAQKEVLAMMANHLGKAHPTQNAELATFVALATTYLLVTDFVDIPPTETALLHSYELNRTAVLQILGLGAPSEKTAAVLH